VARATLLFPVLLACARLAAAAPPDTDTLIFDPAQSHAEFGVRVMWLIPVHGRFDAVHGTIRIDRFRSSARVEALIDAGDLHMRSHADETWAKSAEFFDAQHYPQIQFLSEPFSLERLKRGGEIAGDLTIRGITRRARFDIDASLCPDAVARDCAAEAAGTIRRSDFGMRSRRGAVSDKVDLSFSIHVLAPAKPAAP
jgi:polyisoprenoid-binding protein YceI